jgi:hypothetical protein
MVVLYLRGKLRLGALALLAAWLFLPTTINETKATLFLLPVALLLPAFLMRGKSHAVRRLLPLCAFGALALMAFVGTYNYFTQFREYSEPIGELVGSADLREYLYTGAANTDQANIGRFDSIELALEHTADDPFTLAFGFGAGNVSESFLPAFAGRFSDYYVRFGVGQTQVTAFLWEIGVVGLLAYLFLFYVVARDSVRLARSSDSAAVLGHLWVVVMIIMTFGLLYKSLLAMNDFGYLFWYFSGVVASRTAALRRTAPRRAAQRLPPSWRLAVDDSRGRHEGLAR